MTCTLGYRDARHKKTRFLLNLVGSGSRRGTVDALSIRRMFFSSFRLVQFVSVLAACLGTGAISSFAQPIFLPVASTPYDRQMSPISPFLDSPPGPLAGRTPLVTLNRWITGLRAIRYQYSPQWRTPAQVSSDVTADCKGKAILLYAILRANGATHVRFVIGKHRETDLRTHAWLEWDTIRGTYLLDPTFNRTVQRAGEHDPGMYIPHYAYNGPYKYRAVTDDQLVYPAVVASN